MWNASEQMRSTAQKDAQVRAKDGLYLGEGCRGGAPGSTEEAMERQCDRETGLAICFFFSLSATILPK